MIRPPPTSPLFPHPALFLSIIGPTRAGVRQVALAARRVPARGPRHLEAVVVAGAAAVTLVLHEKVARPRLDPTQRVNRHVVCVTRIGPTRAGVRQVALSARR